MAEEKKGLKKWTRAASRWAAPRALKALQLLLSRTPAHKAEAMGERLGRIWWAVSRRRRIRAVKNIALAFPSLSPQEHEDMARRSFLHFGRVTADFLSGSGSRLEEIEATMDIVGRPLLDEALAQGKGVMLVTGHFGHWERAARWMSLSGYPVSVVARDADQSDVNEMVNEVRRGPGTEVIARGNAARPVIERLRAGEVVAIVPDQNSKESFLPFFGHRAGTVLGPGVLAERTGCLVIPCACVWVAPGRYEFKFSAALEPQTGEGFSRGEGLMRSFNLFLESAIREHPEQYLWVHDRWRFARRKGFVPPDS